MSAHGHMRACGRCGRALDAAEHELRVEMTRTTRAAGVIANIAQLVYIRDSYCRACSDVLEEAVRGTVADELGLAASDPRLGARLTAWREGTR